MDFEKLKVKEINDLLTKINVDEYMAYIPKLMEDSRESVKKLGIKIKKKHDKYLDEKQRLENLWSYENELFASGYKIIAGIDEAGRGPLAGPVVASAVILPPNLFIEGIDDSKKISMGKREELFEVIKEKAIGIGVGIVDNSVIDEINIFKATQLAMKNAIENLPIKPEYLLIDAVTLDQINMRQNAIIKGDSKSISIAAASIIAKVTRDRIMEEYDGIYPQYGFTSHKGYGTKLHYDNIMACGISPIHRKSFLKNIMDEIKKKNP